MNSEKLQWVAPQVIIVLPAATMSGCPSLASLEAISVASPGAEVRMSSGAGERARMTFSRAAAWVLLAAGLRITGMGADMPVTLMRQNQLSYK